MHRIGWGDVFICVNLAVFSLAPLQSGCDLQPPMAIQDGVTAPLPPQVAQCQSAGEAYGAAWLAPTSLAVSVAGPERISGWPQAFTSLEDDLTLKDLPVIDWQKADD